MVDWSVSVMAYMQWLTRIANCYRRRLSSLSFFLLCNTALYKNILFASCSHSLLCHFASRVVFEKECHLRYHSFSLFLFQTYLCVLFWRTGPFVFFAFSFLSTHDAWCVISKMWSCITFFASFFLSYIYTSLLGFLSPFSFFLSFSSFPHTHHLSALQTGEQH